MTRDDFLALLRTTAACEPAMAWIATQPDATPRQLWETCPEWDWLIWLIREFVDYDAIEPVMRCQICAHCATSRYRIREARPADAEWIIALLPGDQLRALYPWERTEAILAELAAR